MQAAEHKRDKAAQVLQTLQDYHAELTQKCAVAEQAIQCLQARKGDNMTQGAKASALMMLEQAIQDQRLYMAELRCEIAALDKAILEQKQKWAKQHKACKAHERMAHTQAVSMQKKQAQAAQSQLDDQFLARRFVGAGYESTTE